MAFRIEDGKGTGKTAEVTSKNRLSVASVMSLERHDASDDGNAYTVNVELVLTGSLSSTSLFYMKNLESESVIIASVFASLGSTTSGSGDATVEFIRNPTAGTLVDADRSVTPKNFNFGSANTISVTSLTGSEQETLTDGTSFFIYRATSPKEFLLSEDSAIPIILPNGSSLGIRYTPFSGNLMQSCSFNILFYRE